MSGESNCVFCKIVAGDVPSYNVWENETHTAFLTLWPNTEGFTVVIPKEHAPSYIFEASDEVMHSTIDAAKEVSLQIDRAFDDVARCAMIFEGYGVDHLHAKLVPLHGTASLEEWKAINSKDMKDFYDSYPGYVSSHDSHQMEADKLEEVAEKIRSAA